MSIIITGVAGFIGSNLLSKLNNEGFYDIILVDDFSNPEKNKNFEGKKYLKKINRDEFFDWAKENAKSVEFIFHIGARTDTTEFDKSIFDKLNLNYTKNIWLLCADNNIPLIYASSAATYGDGNLGYSDNHDVIENLKPLNPYGESKNEFDKWALKQPKTPPYWAGMKFFNVFGPNEYHKGRMASVIFHSFNQIKKTGGMKLFRSHRPDYNNGEQIRDFIYVKDLVNVLFFLMKTQKQSGIYNLGTGKARTFLDLTKAVFKALEIEENISFIDTPKDIRDKYQYYTQAEMQKLRNIGYTEKFTELEDATADYVKNYLMKNVYN